MNQRAAASTSKSKNSLFLAGHGPTTSHVTSSTQHNKYFHFGRTIVVSDHSYENFPSLGPAGCVHKQWQQGRSDLLDSDSADDGTDAIVRTDYV